MPAPLVSAGSLFSNNVTYSNASAKTGFPTSGGSYILYVDNSDNQIYTFSGGAYYAVGAGRYEEKTITADYTVLATDKDNMVFTTTTEKLTVTYGANLDQNRPYTIGCAIDSTYPIKINDGSSNTWMLIQGQTASLRYNATSARRDIMGVSPELVYLGSLVTTDNAWTTIRTFAVPDDCVVRAYAEIVGTQTDGTNRAIYDRGRFGYRTGGANTVSEGTYSNNTGETNTNWNCRFRVTSTDVQLQVRGDTGETVNWEARYKIQYVYQ